MGGTPRRAHMLVEKSNYARYADCGFASQPSVIFDMVWPHFRTAASDDVAELNRPADAIGVPAD
jgi:hypothetical protein